VHTVRAGRHLGCATHLGVVSALDRATVESLLDAAEAELVRLESRWSRFVPDSDVRRMNREAGGPPVVVSPDTVDLVELAVAAWRDTGALFDPTVHDALVAAGYDRSFELLDDGEGQTQPGADPRPGGVSSPPSTLGLSVPGCVGIEVDRDASTVRLPAGTHLDLGGIGKGRAADLVLSLVLHAGADGACVNLGGDLVVAGPSPDGGAWRVGIADPFDDERDVATVALQAGAVATSARWRRQWRAPDGTIAHHLIDPATGRPADRGLAQVSVLAADAVTAETSAKAAFVAGLAWGSDLLAGHGLTGVFVTDRGVRHDAERFGAFAVAPVEVG
jgi:thiamine biosynthesis lipoprotein